MEDLKELLRRMGINSLYRGQKVALRSVELVLEDENRLLDVVNRIHEVVGAEQEKSWTAVERQLRTTVSVAWRTNPQLLENIAGYPLTKQPTASEFIEILYNYTVRNLIHK